MPGFKPVISGPGACSHSPLGRPPFSVYWPGIRYEQCYQMLKLKVAKAFLKVAKKVATVVFGSKMEFSKKPKIHQVFGLLM